MTPENKLRLDAYYNAKQKKKLDKDKRHTMGLRQVDKKQDAYNRSVNASKDDYMRKAMTKIRQDKRSHADDLTMFNGSYLHSKSSN